VINYAEPFQFSSWSVLHLGRTMLTGNLPAYVDRFACDWLRFSTTDPIHGHQTYYSARRMGIATYFFMNSSQQTH
jgi:hypothetical protein